MQVVVKNIICIFTIKDGEVYVALDNNKLPSIKCSDNIDLVNKNYINKLNIDGLNLKQAYTFSEKKDDILTFYILFNDIINYDNLKGKLDIIPLNEMKNDIFISKSINFFRNDVIINKNLMKIFNKEFALPELQKLLEDILGKCFDRRNFRKKLINGNIIEPVDKVSNSDFGRPAKLYRFKNIDERKII